MKSAVLCSAEHGVVSTGPLDSSFCKPASRCHQGLVADDLHVWVFITQQWNSVSIIVCITLTASQHSTEF